MTRCRLDGLGRLVVPGKQRFSIWLSMLIGIVAVIIATAFGRQRRQGHRRDRPPSFR
jgi:hypothetical protein